MPKQTAARTIDEWQSGSSSGSIAVGVSGGGGGLVVHDLFGPYHNGTLDVSQAPWAALASRLVSAGDGLTGGGDLTADVTLALTTPGNLTATSTNTASGNHTHAIDGTIARSAIVISAGDGLTGGGDLTANRTLTLSTPGNLSATSTSTAAGNHTHVIDSTIARSAITISAGNGLTGGGDLTANRTLAVQLRTTSGLVVDGTGLAVGAANTLSANGAGAGLSVEANQIKLTASASPGAQAAILASDSNGYLTLVRAIASDRLRAPTLDTASGALSLSPANGRVGVNVAANGAALDIVAVSTSDHTQRIKQIANQTGRLWRIEDTGGNELIVLDSAGDLQSGNPGFVSGLTGWQITPTGTAEFNNIIARGEFHASIFVMNEFHATGGTFVTATAGKLLNDAVLSNASDEALTNVRTTAFNDQVYLDCRSTNGTGTGITARSIENWLEIKDPPSGHAIIFTSGDVVRCKTFTGSAVYDLWMSINSATDMSTYYRYHVQIMSGSYTTLPAGSAVIKYGKSGDGMILQTADLSSAPYLDVFTVGSAPWAGDIKPRVRLGRLDGVGVPGVSGTPQYGIVAGTDLSDPAAPYFVASNTQLKSYRINSVWNDGNNDTASISSTGRVKFGTNVGVTSSTGFDFDPSTGNLTIGNASYPGTVTVYGNITVANTIPNTSISGLGSLATASAVDWTSNVNNRPTELTDGRVSTALNSSGFLTTKVLPGSNVGTPAGAGLYLGADKMGYYSGSAWTLYFDSFGKMGLGGTSGARLGWDGTDLFGTDGTTVQWYARSTTGKLWAGAGNVRIDSNGISVQEASAGAIALPNAYTFFNGSTTLGGLYAFRVSSTADYLQTALTSDVGSAYQQFFVKPASGSFASGIAFQVQDSSGTGHGISIDKSTANARTITATADSTTINSSATGGGDRNTSTLNLVDYTAPAADVGAQIYLGGTYYSVNQSLNAGAFIRAYKVNSTDGNVSYGLKFGTRNNGVATMATAMTIDNVGNVGIGTTSPSSLLTVNGTISATNIMGVRSIA